MQKLFHSGVFGAFVGGGLAVGVYQLRKPNGSAETKNTVSWYRSLGPVDHTRLRHGFEVYKQACANCHGIKTLSWHDLKGVTHTKEEVELLVNQTNISNVNPMLVKDKEGREEAPAPIDLGLALSIEGSKYVLEHLQRHHEEQLSTWQDSSEVLHSGQKMHCGGFNGYDQDQIRSAANDLGHFLQWTEDTEKARRQQLHIKLAAGVALIIVLWSFTLGGFYVKNMRYFLPRSHRRASFK